MTQRNPDTPKPIEAPMDDGATAFDAVAAEQASGDATGATGDSDSADSAADAAAEQEIVSLATEVASQKDKYLRLLADYENFRKRSVRERQEAELKGMGLLLKGLLDTLDDLGRFAHLDPASTDSKAIVEGVELVERKLLKSLAGHGLEIVNPVNAVFDPTFQEALTTTAAATEEEDHFVAQVYQVGYVFNGMLLRPARVVVKQWQGAAPGAVN
ncbi:MAG: nucleotide exchange factor GrpE [Gemmatimonadetes bacterium]|nr:MAG: nucleotide exchange factor GrpE [Gemmatimonadota bacterium]